MRTQHIDPTARLLVGDAYDSNALLLLHGKKGLLIDAMASAGDAEDLQRHLMEPSP